jgi:hypothetical protein
MKIILLPPVVLCFRPILFLVVVDVVNANRKDGKISNEMVDLLDQITSLLGKLTLVAFHFTICCILHLGFRENSTP